MPDVPPTLPDPADRVPIKDKVAWALGSMGDNYASQAITQLAMPIYNVALGVPAAMLANAIAIPRMLDAFADPTVGYLSDNTRSRWGRRRPYILAGAVPLAVLMVVLWIPNLSWSKETLAWYFAVATFFYYLAYAVFIVAYRALGFELTRDYNERTRVQGWGMIFGLLGGLGIPWLYKITLVVGGIDPASTAPPPEQVLRGVQWTSIGVALIILITCTAPALFCRERVHSGTQPRISILDAVLQTLKNWPFLVMLVARTMVLIATFAVAFLSAPLAIYYLYGGDQSSASTLLGFAGNVLFAGAAIGIPFNTWMSARIGKRTAFLICLGIAAVGCASQAWSYRPEHPYAILVSNFILGFGLQGVWLMCQSMVADVCDEDELRTGRRREGIYGASYALMEKLGINVGLYWGGVIAAWCGYTAGQATAQTLQNIWLAAIVVPVIGMILSAGCIWIYPLSRERMAAIRSQLDARGASIA